MSFGRIAFAIRSAGEPDAAFFQCWQHFLMKGMRKGDIALPIARELPHHIAANILADQFLASPADSICFLDDDQIWTNEDMAQLRDNPLNDSFAVVGALYCTRRAPNSPIVLLPEGELFRWYIPTLEDKTISVGMVGLGMTIIKREVFAAIEKPFFAWGADAISGEDCTFCKKARAAGFGIGVDTSVSIGHRVKVVATWDKAESRVVYSAIK